MVAGGTALHDDVGALEAAVRNAVSRAIRPSLAGHVDDIVQGAMERLVARIEKDASAAPRTRSYVWKLANHAVIDQIRKLQRSREQPGDVDAPAEGNDPSDGLRRARIGVAINDCVSALPEERRRAVTLFLLGHGVTEAAQMLEWPRKRADNAVYRGLAAVRRCLEGKGVTP